MGAPAIILYHGRERDGLAGGRNQAVKLDGILRLLASDLAFVPDHAVGAAVADAVRARVRRVVKRIGRRRRAAARLVYRRGAGGQACAVEAVALASFVAGEAVRDVRDVRAG